jgi:hypothetical protein
MAFPILSLHLGFKISIASITLKKHLSLTLVALSGLILFSCKYSYKDETINVKNEFTMSVPDYLSPAENLKPGADFQYSNRFRNMYVVVFSDKKDKDFQAYYREQIGIIERALVKPMVNDSIPVEIAGAKGIHTEISGRMQGDMIYYSVLTLETRDKFYQDCIWTRDEDRKLKYNKDIQRILLSFKLVKP